MCSSAVLHRHKMVATRCVCPQEPSCTHMHGEQGGVDEGSWLPVQVHVSWIESGTAVFSFRGTESTQDGLQDLKLIRRNIDFLARSCPGAKAHTGVHLRSMVIQGSS